MVWGLTARRICAAIVCVCLLVTPVFAQEQAAGTIHVVQRGETLFRIAQRYGLTTDAIATANGILNPSSILVGQRLLIPLADVELPPETYTVQYADTLQAIANVFGTDVGTLTALNNLANPNAIFVGQVLTIRGTITEPVKEALPPAQEVDDSAPTPVASNIVHRIQRGETLFRIALRYGVSMADIQTLNGISNPSHIITGTDIIIPAGGETAASALPEGIASIELTPQVLLEGKTGRVRIATSAPATVTIDFFNRSIPVITTDNLSHLAFAAIPLGATTGIYQMTITVTALTGEISSLAFNVQVNSGGYGTQYVTLPANKVELLAPAVEQNEMSILSRVTAPFTMERYFDGPMGLPAAASMFSAYGANRSFNSQGLTHYHTGADFAGAPGTPVLAAAPGRVVLADTLHIRGVAAVIDHGWGVYTVYAHMNERYVTIGEFVQTGQVIGTIGSTGRATGAHLHWEVWVNGVAVDPMQWALQAFP